MNSEKPKFKLWEDIVNETILTIQFMEQQLAIQRAILIESRTHAKRK